MPSDPATRRARPPALMSMFGSGGVDCEVSAEETGGLEEPLHRVLSQDGGRETSEGVVVPMTPSEQAWAELVQGRRGSNVSQAKLPSTEG